MAREQSRIQGVSPKSYKGINYRSTLEADTAETLDLLGIPFSYESRKFILLEGFKCPYQKDKVRSIHYTPDFIVGNILIECKGFETPEWRIKKKYVFKYLQEKEPNLYFYQTKNSKADIVNLLDEHLSELGYKVQVTSELTKKKESRTYYFSTIKEAMINLRLEHKPLGIILKSLTGRKLWVYHYNWKLVKI